MHELDLVHEIRFAPYNQVLQSIFDPRGLLGANAGGVNTILLRPSDWKDAGEGAVEDLAKAIAGVPASADWIVVVCPSADGTRMDANLVSRLKTRLPFVHFAPFEDVLDLYPVAEVFDETADALGRVPYTAAFFAALATWIARRIQALRMAPYKVLALDCDNTLWQGICGEDGPSGVTAGPGQRALHEFALAQREAGMLLCLCSKNNEADVLETFRSHPEFPLRLEHFAAWRLNWQAKSANLPALSAELGLGLDSFIFLDDDRRECAEVISDCPAVLTLPLPEAPEAIAPFLKQVWAFDRPRVTEADRQRSELYRQGAERKRAERQAGTFAEFIAGLELSVSIRPPSEDQIARVAQLTQRTNQMNCSTVRRSEGELRAFLSDAGGKCLCAHVSDRFGDYGLVGVMLFTEQASHMFVDTFLLSCRALGRGVEHKMLAHLGQYAEDRGIAALEIPFRETPKNTPARDFLMSIGTVREGAVRLRSRDAAHTQWRVSAPPAGETQPPDAPVQRAATRRFDDYLRIAVELGTVEQILARVSEWKSRSRTSRLPHGAAPQNEIERGLAAIWENLLGVPAVGREESFFDLGGHSLLAVQLLSRVRQEFGVELSLDVVYGGPLTVAELARTIEIGELGAVSPAEYEALLSEIEAMPDDEVRAYLEAEEKRERN